MKPQIRISLAVEDHDRPQPGDVEIGQSIINPDGPSMIWHDISKADWPLLAANWNRSRFCSGRRRDRDVHQDVEHC